MNGVLAKKTIVQFAEFLLTLMTLKKLCDFPQFNYNELVKIHNELLPYCEECYDVQPTDNNLKHLFDKNDEYYFSHRDYYTGQKHKIPLS